MTDQQMQTVVRLAADGLRNRRSAAEIVDGLVKVGVPADLASKLFGDIKSAIQHGVQSMITGIEKPPADALLLVAYRQGQSAMQGATWRAQAFHFLRWAMVILVAAIIVWQIVCRG